MSEDQTSRTNQREIVIKMNDDAIAHLSDQLVAITTRLRELERKQFI
jgi:hypothetical protein